MFSPFLFMRFFRLPPMVMEADGIDPRRGENESGAIIVCGLKKKKFQMAGCLK